MELKTISYKNFLYSLEEEQKEVKKNIKADDDDVKNSNKLKKRNTFDDIKELPRKAEHVRKRFQLWARKRKNLGFYKKYLDRVQSGLFERYAGEAHIVENKMIDDPVSILKGPAQEYIRDIIEDINKLYTEILKMSKTLETKLSAETAISVVKDYCKEYLDQNKKGEKVDQDKLKWKERILNSTKYKIARILLRHGERQVYGYTAKNMVLKGYPKPNHLIVTMFVTNPEEHPQRQNVSDIFSSADSFELLADSEKQDIFSVSSMTAACLNKTVDNKVMNEIKLYKSKAIHSFKAISMPNKKDDAKIIDSIWEGMNEASKELLSRKRYIMDMINIYYDMILRIDKLAVQSIKNMLDVENAYRDRRYDKSLKVGHKRDTNIYDKDGDGFKTAYDKKYDDWEEAKRNRGKKHYGKHDDLVQQARDLNRLSK